MSLPLLRRCPDKVPCWDVWALVRGVVLQSPTHLCPNCSCSLPPRAQHFWWEFTAGLKATMSGGPQRLTGRANSRGWALISPLPIQQTSGLSRASACSAKACKAHFPHAGPSKSQEGPSFSPRALLRAAPIPVIDGYHLTVSSHC